MRHNNIYLIDLDNASSSNISCLVAKEENPWLWHKRAAYIHKKHLNKELVIVLPKIKFEKINYVLKDSKSSLKVTTTAFIKRTIRKSP